MYLSQLRLNPSSRRVQSDLMAAYGLHQSVLAIFSPKKDDRILYRLETDPITAAPIILAQSIKCVPKPTDNDYLLEWHSKPLNSIQLTGVMSFRLRANPTATKNGRRYGLYYHNVLQDWITRQLKAAGCAMLQVAITPMQPIQDVKRKNGRSHHLNISVVQYEGRLKVEDSDLLWNALAQGIGPGKAFGCGLLSLGGAS